MRKLLAVLLLVPSIAYAADTSPFTLIVHVVSSRIRPGGNGLDLQYLEVTIDGTPMELTCGYPGPLVPGDYPGRVSSKANKAPSYVKSEKYELQMPDKTTKTCYVNGVGPGYATNP